MLAHANAWVRFSAAGDSWPCSTSHCPLRFRPCLCSKDLQHDNIVSTHMAALHVEVSRTPASAAHFFLGSEWQTHVGS